MNAEGEQGVFFVGGEEQGEEDETMHASERLGDYTWLRRVVFGCWVDRQPAGISCNVLTLIRGWRCFYRYFAELHEVLLLTPSPQCVHCGVNQLLAYQIYGDLVVRVGRQADVGPVGGESSAAIVKNHTDRASLWDDDQTEGAVRGLQNAARSVVLGIRWRPLSKDSK